MKEVILAGFGGQGILSMGKFIAMSGLEEGANVSWLPSYGPEMRGGTANCNVIVADEVIGSPIIAKADAIIVMNQPSLEKFENTLKPGGVAILDSSLVPVMPTRKDIEVYAIPATEKAYELGNKTFAGIILLGKLIETTGIVKRESFEQALYKILPPKKHGMIPEEMNALDFGAKY